MNCTPVKAIYTGGLPTGTTVVDIFNSVTAFPRPAGAIRGPMGNYAFSLLQTFISANADDDSVITFQKSDDGGTNWVTVGATVTADSSASPFRHQFNVEGFADFRVTWTNGGTAQTAFSAEITLSYDKTNSEGVYDMEP